ncbi:hypothetical protein D3C84_799800 [compost metagenome]
MVFGAGGHCRHRLVHTPANAVFTKCREIRGHQLLLAASVSHGGHRVTHVLGMCGVESAIGLDHQRRSDRLASAAGSNSADWAANVINPVATSLVRT